MQIELSYLDEECNSFNHKTDIFNLEIIERSEKGLLVYIADSRINDSFWVDPSEIIFEPNEVRVGYQTELSRKERQHWLKTRQYRLIK